MKYHTFLPQFHPLILSGRKTTTIRGSTRLREGERFALRHWTARPYGSPMGWLATARCSRITGIKIRNGDTVVLGGEHISNAWRLDQLAIDDGFMDWAALRAHFAKRIPFDGVHITWRDLVPGKPEAA